MKSTRPDLGDSSLGSVVAGKREPKREKTVLVSTISVTSPSACSATVSTLSPASPTSESNGNSFVLATPLGVLGVAVKRSSDKETEGRPPKPGLSSSESPVGIEFMENGLAVEVEVDVVEIVVVGDVDMNVVLTGLAELVAALVTELVVVTGLVLLEVDVSAAAEVTRLKSKPKSEGTELVSSGSSDRVVGLLVVVLPPSGATMSGLIGISKGIVIRAMLGAVTVGKVTLGKVTLPSILDNCVPS